MIDRLTSKRVVLVLVLLSAAVILVSGSREWVSGSVDDAVFGASALHGKGSQVAPGALAAALVGLASAVAAATSGRVVRVIASGSALLAAALGAAVIISVLLDPSGALSRLAASGTGRTGALAAHGRVGTWVWVALVATLVMGVAGLAALVGGRRWHGLSSRYDAPVTAASSAMAPGVSGSAQGEDSGPVSGRDSRRVSGRVSERVPPSAPVRRESEWDQLSRGEDPTVEAPASPDDTAPERTVGDPTRDH